jgi:hypothetical protein
MPFNIDPRRIPVIGNSVYNVGQVYRTVSIPCSPDPVVMVQATFAYAPTMIWALIKPEPLELAYERAGRRHRRVRRRRFNAVDFIQLEAPRAGTAGWYMFRVAQFGERVGWYLLVADATTTFAVNWTSMVWEWSGCQTPATGYARCFGAFGTIGTTLTTQTLGVPWPEFESTGSGFATSASVRVTSPGPKTFGGSVILSIVSNTGGTGTIDRVWVERTISGFPPTAIDIEGIPQASGGTAYTVPDVLPGPSVPQTTWRMFVTWSQGRLEHEGGSMQCVAAREGGLAPDP